MSEAIKYLPQTATALAKLQETATLLETNADTSMTNQQELQETLSLLRRQIADKAYVIDNIINTLNGALE